MFLGKGVLEICSKFTGEHPCRSAISIKMLCIFIEITLQHVCYPIKLLHIFRTPFLKNTSGRLLLCIVINYFRQKSLWTLLPFLLIPPEVFYKINFAYFAGKNLLESVFNKVSVVKWNSIRKETLAQVFSCHFFEVFKSTFFTKHLRATASVVQLFSQHLEFHN